MGLCVVLCRALFNGRLGVTGGFSELVSKVSAGSVHFDWRGWFALGIVGGGVLFMALGGGPDIHGYGWMTDTFHGTGQIAIGALLLVSGVLVGFGAKTAGGCTSGNGLTGNSIMSAASMVSSMTFFATAIVVSFVVKALI